MFFDISFAICVGVSTTRRAYPFNGRKCCTAFGRIGEPRFREAERNDKSPSLRTAVSSSRSRSNRRREQLPRELRAKAGAARKSLDEANPNGGLPTPEVRHGEASNPALIDAQCKLYDELMLLLVKHNASPNVPIATCGAELFTCPNTG